MKTGLTSFSPIMALALLSLPVTAWADHNPDFDDDAKPILRMQAGLLEYVEGRFQVKDTGLAKVPGDDDRHAMPPYIFLAKPRGYPGDYYITLLIQPGAPGHILKVVDPTKPNGGAPSHTTSSAAPKSAPATPHPGPTSQAPAQSSKPQTPPTADTPSGPISSNGQPSLEPPPDPAPPTH